MSIVYTLDQYTALKAAISQGAIRVKYGDKEVEYRTLDEMKGILSMMEAELYPKKSSGRTYGSYSKGI